MAGREEDPGPAEENLFKIRNIFLGGPEKQTRFLVHLYTISCTVS